jgi:hypothetical protein
VTAGDAANSTRAAAASGARAAPSRALRCLAARHHRVKDSRRLDSCCCTPGLLESILQFGLAEPGAAWLGCEVLHEAKGHVASKCDQKDLL